MSNKKIVYVDLEDTIFDYSDFFERAKKDSINTSKQGFYATLRPVPGAIDAFEWLCQKDNLEVYILASAPICSPQDYTKKHDWVKKHIGMKHTQRLIFFSHKNLLAGDCLIDCQDGGPSQETFKGIQIKFKNEGFESWDKIKNYIKKIGLVIN